MLNENEEEKDDQVSSPTRYLKGNEDSLQIPEYNKIYSLRKKSEREKEMERKRAKEKEMRKDSL